MAEDPEQLKRNIELSRRNVGRDVDALTEKVSPGRVVGRRVDRARSGIDRMRERVMGSVGDTAGSALSSVQDAGSAVGETVGSAPDLARARTRGTPLAAGVIAFAAGWVAAAALPASTKERQVTQEAKDTAMDAAGQVKEQATQMAQEVKESLSEPAQEAVEQVKHSASQAADEVAGESRSAAQQAVTPTAQAVTPTRPGAAGA